MIAINLIAAERIARTTNLFRSYIYFFFFFFFFAFYVGRSIKWMKGIFRDHCARLFIRTISQVRVEFVFVFFDKNFGIKYDLLSRKPFHSKYSMYFEHFMHCMNFQSRIEIQYLMLVLYWFSKDSSEIHSLSNYFEFKIR